jgi:hypothetical protein
MNNQLPILCNRCGALSRSIVCDHCGNLLIEVSNIDMEELALNKFHELLSKQPIDNIPSYIKNGFIPTYEPVLVDAGIRIIPYINLHGKDSDESDNAITRLTAIIKRLELLPKSKERDNAIYQFKSIVSESERTRRLSCLSGLLAFLIVCIIVPIVFISLLFR